MAQESNCMTIKILTYCTKTGTRIKTGEASFKRGLAKDQVQAFSFFLGTSGLGHLQKVI
jgi:hypothetical protein